jgi:aspartate/glutamate racemase
MTSLAIVGGLGPPITIVYYRLIIGGFRRRRPDAGYPSIIINSIDMQCLLGALGGGDHNAAIDHLFGELQ